MYGLRDQQTAALNISFETFYSGQFTLSTQLIIPKYPVIPFHWHSAIVFFENLPSLFIYQLTVDWYVNWYMQLETSALKLFMVANLHYQLNW